MGKNKLSRKHQHKAKNTKMVNDMRHKLNVQDGVYTALSEKILPIIDNKSKEYKFLKERLYDKREFDSDPAKYRKDRNIEILQEKNLF